jgi:AcrR family transcriptional regulator
MGRWEPNARERLEQSARELFHERGYDRTTVEEIAARAGLTERTFFRYFADKREVLFRGAGALQSLFSETIAGAPAETAPLDAVAAALEGCAALLPSSRDAARERQQLIAAHAELREREQLKLTSLAAVVAEALRARGVGEPAASLTAEAGVAVFKVAFTRWIEDTKPRDLLRHMRASLAELKAVVAGTGSAAPAARVRKPARPKAPKRRRAAD